MFDAKALLNKYVQVSAGETDPRKAISLSQRGQRAVGRMAGNTKATGVLVYGIQSKRAEGTRSFTPYAGRS